MLVGLLNLAFYFVIRRWLLRCLQSDVRIGLHHTARPVYIEKHNEVLRLTQQPLITPLFCFIFIKQRPPLLILKSSVTDLDWKRLRRTLYRFS